MSDSYDMAVSRSRDLFLRSRLELAAAHVLFLPSCLVRDAGLGLVRGNMLALLFGSTETRVGGQLRKRSGILLAENCDSVCIKHHTLYFL